ncbi:hypothetical protein [Phaeacidiphilus oryzae]|uniref:hypothetical protein n=1 Tax=Phaeacidiphilus oryzae TaxID=348818 RepID=UPI000563142D|nr:hypothetical protein [Phaeacidiphilus oryzae]
MSRGPIPARARPQPRARAGARSRVRPRARSRPRALAAAGLAALAGLALLATGCSASAPGPAGAPRSPAGAAGAAGAARTERELGRVPIPTAPATPLQPTASPGRAQLVAMGVRVHVVLGALGGTITALGPEFAAGSSMDRRAGRVTVRTTGPGLRVCAGEFAFHDELGRRVPVHTVGPSCGAAVTLAGTFDSGHTTLTWTRARLTVVTWDFEVELD